MSRRKERRWHRRIAGSAVAIILWFALSGIVLNHAQDLALESIALPGPLTRIFYATGLPANLAGHQLDGIWIVALDDTLYHGTTAVGACPGLRGAARLGDWHVVACADVVYVIDRDGRRVEQIDGTWGLPADVIAIAAATASSLAISSHDATLCLDTSLAALQRCEMSVVGIAARPLPADVRGQLSDALSPPAVDLERFMHDLHGGRLFGSGARWLWDIFALALLALAASGLWLMRRRQH